MAKKSTTIEDLARMTKKGFDAVDKRFDAVDKRFDAVDKRLDAIDERLDHIEQFLLEDHRRRITKLEDQVKELYDSLLVKPKTA